MTIRLLLLLTLLAFTMPGMAGTDHDAHHQHESDAEEAHEGVGEVRELHEGETRITLYHEPMESMGWPAMTMDFKLESASLADDFSEGDKVHFVMEVRDGEYVIKALHHR